MKSAIPRCETLEIEFKSDLKNCRTTTLWMLLQHLQTPLAAPFTLVWKTMGM